MVSDNEEISDPLGDELAEAMATGKFSEVDRVIRANDFLLLQQFNPETGEVELSEDGSFHVVLVEVDDTTAVVAFTQDQYASEFLNDVQEELPEAEEFPAVVLDGNTLLDGLPEECGLLVNPGMETECYLSPEFRK